MDAFERIAALGSALGVFGTGLSQHARLLTLASAQDGALPQALMAERFRGREGVNESYLFEVDALSTSTDLELDQFIGEELTLTLLQPDGARRAWHGLCTAAEWLGADGGVARYRLRLEPALALLRLRRDSYIFQDKHVRDIVTELFADYPQLRFEFDLQQELAERPICTQYRESDYDFFVRLMVQEGLSWRFEHDQADEGADGQARHKLVIFDSEAAAPALPGDPALRFHGMRATDRDDAVDGFSAKRRLAANAVTISSWDPAQLVAPGAELESQLDAGELPLLPVYDGSGERIASDTADLHGRLMLRALEMDNKLFEGQGAVRRLAPGYAFSLTQHERYPEGENAFKTLWIEHEGRNNIDAHMATAEAAGWVEPGTYRNVFCCVRETVPIVPRASALPHAHTALGPQTALVVGVPDAVATTARDHQVRVQFAWQRGAMSNPGGLAHDVDEDGAAPGDERSGTWVRVAEALAGPNWGSQFTPRIGTEVLVDFIENDIDRPLVVAQLYTGADVPPFPAGIDAPTDHAGTISGIHTRNFDGGGYNQWQLDDTQGQLRMRLASSSAATQLNLGYLIQQSPGSAQRGGYRGSGFELRTDAWAVVRGGDGVLLTTRTRAAQGAGVASSQMDAAESLAALKAARELDTGLLDAAAAQHALSSKVSREAQRALMAQIDPQEQGKFAVAVGGQEPLKAKSGARELDAAAPVERFALPLVVMDSQAGINWATPASTLTFAGQQLHWTTQGDMHKGAGFTVSSVAAEAANLYAHEGGIQAVAGNGPVSLQAHTGELEILADKDVVVLSVNDSIEIKAKQKIVLQAGQASITLEGGNITFACPGGFSVKGGQHLFEGGASAMANLPALPGTLAGPNQHWIGVAYVDPDTAEGISDVDYEIRFERGPVMKGTLDKKGLGRHDNVPLKPVKEIIYKPRPPLEEDPHSPLERLFS
ncbi:type VI secretion system Vgr family protein [Massilia sp. DD77]|uniref:type VI secretion system Vgr family protein n=1 Tax=Massilia sp. DD77 TaxID=3109349 RepID=UPI002FFE1C83